MTELLNHLIANTGLGRQDLRRIIKTAPKRYKRFKIPKRNGGFRDVSQPSPILKALQRALVEKYLSQLPVHETAKAYKKQTSIRDNALQHVGDGPILKYDFKDFFPSITSQDWEKYCAEHHLFESEDDLYITTQLLFCHFPNHRLPRLAIGAPSSPILSNILMEPFDRKLTTILGQDQVRYTRYADDLTFSAPRTGYLTVVDKTLRQVISTLAYPRLHINEEKTVRATRRYMRAVTGLILTNDGEVSIGHEKKRSIRAAVHHASLGKLDGRQLAQLCGYLAFIKSVEPSFFDRLTATYGQNLIASIQRCRTLKEDQSWKKN